MKTLVIYKSISGFTKRYAHLIADGLKADCISLAEVSIKKIKDYDLVIFGGSLHAVGIAGLKKMNQYFKHYKPDHIIIFAVGASPFKTGIEEEIKKGNKVLQECKPEKLFYLRGGFDYSKLDFVNKILMGLLKLKLMSKKEKEPDETGILSAYDNPVDFVKKENIEKMMSYIRTFKTNLQNSG